MIHALELKKRAIALRKRGKTYSEIRAALSGELPKSTLSYWCQNISLTQKQSNRISKIITSKIKHAQRKAWKINKYRRGLYLDGLYKKNLYLTRYLKNGAVEKIILAILYMTEGSGTRRSSLMFGNSNPKIITLFMRLLRKCYNLDEKKFRITLQGRADQNVKRLEKFWSSVTKVPLSQFYQARIDKRTIGRPSKKTDYKGVCRVDYFSASIYNELQTVARIII